MLVVPIKETWLSNGPIYLNKSSHQKRKPATKGRAYVKSYVEYNHYVERLDNDATGKAAKHHASEGGEAHGGHHQ